MAAILTRPRIKQNVDNWEWCLSGRMNNLDYPTRQKLVLTQIIDYFTYIVELKFYIQFPQTLW